MQVILIIISIISTTNFFIVLVSLNKLKINTNIIEENFNITKLSLSSANTQLLELRNELKQLSEKYGFCNEN